MNDMELMVPADVEDAQSATIVERMDESFVQKVEEIAKNIVPVRQAMEKIITELTYRDDWVIFDDKVSLSSAGAGRLLKAFPFKFDKWHQNKEEWQDDIGPAYRWIYQAECSLWGSKVLVSGKFSTRDKFLGKAHGEWRSLSEINENDIRSAAQHICVGAGIKELLGLRGVPKSELDRIFKSLDRSGTQTKSAQYEAPASGELKAIKDKITKLLKETVGDDLEAMKNLVFECSLFTTKDGQDRSIQSLSTCKNVKWLNTTYGKLQKKKDELDSQLSSMEDTVQE